MMGDFVSDNLMGFDSNKKASYKKWWYGVGSAKLRGSEIFWRGSKIIWRGSKNFGVGRKYLAWVENILAWVKTYGVGS